ncbi:MAG: nucleotidyl transferase AbiEii/AbiGii toxin family protein [Elusimicrobiota bacterium]|jgi:predicted nucleotidyltransferase component of viral defense system
MIFQAAITHWRNVAPWPQDAQVEQDLILSRALVQIFQDSLLAKTILLRGGTALHKLFVAQPLRYSEDIDLVQMEAGPIGPVLDAIRSRLDPVLGKPLREKGPDNVTLRYRMESEIPPVIPLRLKIEINTREHFTVFGAFSRPFSVHSPWFEGRAEVRTYALDELLATKLRALYQRRKGRDIFDLWMGLGMKEVEPGRVVKAFRSYMEAEGSEVSRRAFEENLAAKVSMRQFSGDLAPLLAPAVRYDAGEAARVVMEKLLSEL